MRQNRALAFWNSVDASQVRRSALRLRVAQFTAQLDGDDSECYKRVAEIASSARKTGWALRLQDARPIFQSFVAKTIGKHLRKPRRQAKR
jgi:hypothetical protein